MAAARESPPPSTHPYAVRIQLTLGNNVDLALAHDAARVSFGADGVVTFRKLRDLPHGLTVASVDLEAFATASDAERAGRLLAFSILWVASSKRVTIGFSRWTGALPFAVRDRTRSEGVTGEAELRVSARVDPTEFAEEAGRAFGASLVPPDALITSMQFYAAARLESSEVARFVGVMTALEALAEQRDHGDLVGGVLGDLAVQLEQEPRLVDEGLRRSLASQVRNLRRESVRKAILRTVRAHTEDPAVAEFVDESYGVRSKILHEGTRAPDLDARTHRLEDIMRTIYASATGLRLARPVA